MPKIRLPHEDSDIPQAKAPTNADLVSDDYRSMAAASWSIKREHESTLDDGLRSHWDAAYADELTNFREHGHTGEVQLEVEVMEIVVS
uniref:Uncharacterized protein n=1 Tax=Vitis vinifera TaxID=29760 RepID=A5AUY4_VITVI|nr:hypothetical protein VITISV_018751 [Vitis vinifera]